MASLQALQPLSEYLWELPAAYKPGMRVPARVFADRALVEAMDRGVLEQLANVACLPGLEEYICCMPDAHWGYGFPIGGVAAMRPDDGVVSPGGIGFDINCGMRLLRTDLTRDELGDHLPRLVDQLFRDVPTGAGASGGLRLDREEFSEVLRRGGAWCVERGFGWAEDLERTEDGGCTPGAEPGSVSTRAIERGIDQLGTLGSGNHYLEIQVIPEGGIFDAAAARAFGLFEGQVVVMFHCGIRGFGHQVASDYIERFLDLLGKNYPIAVPDRQLAFAPIASADGQAYLGAMRAAINMAFANRQLILHRVREAFRRVLGRTPEAMGMRQVYDISHNTAKVETIALNGRPRELLVHRKGATRAYGPGFGELPEEYRPIGQPVIIGGSMETGSFLLVGAEGSGAAFHSTAHGAGRLMSRAGAKKIFHGRQLLEDMKRRGITVRSRSLAGLAEEAGGAYKDVDAVVGAAERAGLSRRVARMRPIGNIKG